MASKQKTNPASTPTIVRRPRRAKRTEEEIRAAEAVKRRERQMKAAAKRRAEELKREATLEEQRRRMTGNYIRLPHQFPVCVLSERLNTVRFAGGDAVPVSNAFQSGKMTWVDPLTAHHLVAQYELVDFVDPGLMAGRADWDIYYSDGYSSPEEWLEEDGEPVSAPAPIEEMGIEDRLAMGTADRLDVLIFLALTEEEPWDEDTGWEDGGDEEVPVRPVRRKKPSRDEDPMRPRCDEHRKWQKAETHSRILARAGKQAWLDSPSAE